MVAIPIHLLPYVKKQEKHPASISLHTVPKFSSGSLQEMSKGVANFLA